MKTNSASKTRSNRPGVLKKEESWAIIGIRKLTKELLMSLGENHYFMTGIYPGIQEKIAPQKQREEQWERIKKSRCDGVKCYIFNTIPEDSDWNLTAPSIVNIPANIRDRYEYFMVKENAALGILGKDYYLQRGRGIIRITVRPDGECFYGYATETDDERAERMMLDYKPNTEVVIVFEYGLITTSYCLAIFAFGSESYSPKLPTTWSYSYITACVIGSREPSSDAI